MLRTALALVLTALCGQLSAAAQLAEVSVASNPMAAGAYETVNFQIRNSNGQPMVYAVALSTDAIYDASNQYGNVWVAYSGGFYGLDISSPGYWLNQPQGVPVSTGATGWLPESFPFLVPKDAPATLYLHVLVEADSSDITAPDMVVDIPLTVTGSQDPQWDLQMQKVAVAGTYEQWAARVINRGVWPVSVAQLAVVGWVDESVPVDTIAESGFTCATAGGGNPKNVGGATITVTNIASTSCSASRQANQMVSASLASLGAGMMLPGGGGYAQSNQIMARVYRSDGKALSGTWYSTVAGDSTSSWTDDPYFALYYNGQLVCETGADGNPDPNTGQAPCNITGCTAHTPSPTFTISPTFSASPSISPTWTNTSTITAGPSPTDSPTFTQSPSFSASPSPSCTTTPSYSFTVSPSLTSSITPNGSFTSTITPNGSFTSTGTPTSTATSTGSSTASGTPTSSMTPSCTGTPTSTLSPGPSSTDTLTPGPSPTPTDTITPGPSPTETSTATASPSSTATPTASDTATASPTFSASPTASASPSITVTPEHWHAKLVLAPVPVAKGGAITLFVPAQTASGVWEVYNVAGQRVSSLSFASGTQAWDTQPVSPGIYLVHVKVAYEKGGGGEAWQKVAVVR